MFTRANRRNVRLNLLTAYLALLAAGAWASEKPKCAAAVAAQAAREKALATWGGLRPDGSIHYKVRRLERKRSRIIQATPLAGDRQLIASKMMRSFLDDVAADRDSVVARAALADYLQENGDSAADCEFGEFVSAQLAVHAVLSRYRKGVLLSELSPGDLAEASEYHARAVTLFENRRLDWLDPVLAFIDEESPNWATYPEITLVIRRGQIEQIEGLTDISLWTLSEFVPLDRLFPAADSMTIKGTRDCDESLATLLSLPIIKRARHLKLVGGRWGSHWSWEDLIRGRAMTNKLSLQLEGNPNNARPLRLDARELRSLGRSPVLTSLQKLSLVYIYIDVPVRGDTRTLDGPVYQGLTELSLEKFDYEPRAALSLGALIAQFPNLENLTYVPQHVPKTIESLNDSSYATRSNLRELTVAYWYGRWPQTRPDEAFDAIRLPALERLHLRLDGGYPVRGLPETAHRHWGEYSRALLGQARRLELLTLAPAAGSEIDPPRAVPMEQIRPHVEKAYRDREPGELPKRTLFSPLDPSSALLD